MCASVAIGAGVGMIAQVLDFSSAVAVGACIVATGATELTNALRYRTLSQQVRRALPVPTRRGLITGALATAFIVFISFLRIPSKASLHVEKKLARSASNPINTQSIQEATVTIENARNAHLRIDPILVQRTGDRFVKAAEKTPDAWNAALAFLNYRSILNANLIPKLENPKDQETIERTGYNAKFMFITPSGETNEETATTYHVRFFGEAPPESSARMELLNEPQSKSSGSQFIVFQSYRPDNILLLDNMYMRNVIIQNSAVTYLGGPTHLDHVYFVNCTFNVVGINNGREFANTLLASTPIDFQVVTPVPAGESKPGV
jgi:hypothetical protein